MKIKGAFPVRWAAQDGQPGTGVTIVQTTTRYAKSTSGTTSPTSGWQTSVPDVPDGQYLWTWVYVRYSDGTETNAYSVARMGIDGRGILSSSVTYSQQATSVDPTTITNWGAFPSTLTDGYWLYTKTHVVYSDNESTDSYSVSQVGVGSYYAGCQEYWAKGISDVTPPEGSPIAGTYVNGQTIPISGTWSQDRVQTTDDEPYLWNFEVSADSRGNRYVTQAICIGNFAKGIVSIVESYAISSYGSADSGRSYPSDIASGDWKDEQNAAPPTESKRYQWNRTVVTYNDDSTDTHYHVSAVKGVDGKGAVYIDLDNENDSMLYDGQGTLVSGEVTSSISLYANGAKVVSTPTFSIKEKSSSVTASIDKDSNNMPIVKVSGITSNAGYVIVQCTYNGVNYTSRMTIKRLVGVDKYEIVLNHTAVTYNETKGTLSNAFITLNIYRTAQNGTRTRVSNTTSLNTLNLMAKVYPNGVDTNAEYITFNSSAVGTIILTAAKASVYTNFAVVLFKNNVEIDRETVPINKVEDGSEGHGAIILDLDNENDAMLYDGAGNLKSGNVTSQGKLLDAGEDKTSDVSTWSLRNLKNLSGTISSSGLITITGISADSGSAIAVATYGGKEYTSQITIKKLVGVDKYEIVCTPNALTYNTTKGTGSSQNVVVKIYRTAQNGTRSLVAKLANYSLKLRYYLTNSSGKEFGPNNIADGTSSTSYNNGVTRPLSADTYTQYRFELLDANDQVLDVETVPISKTSDGDSGSAGPGAKSIYATTFEKPSNPTGATPWTASGTIWSENPVEDTLIPITQQGDWIKEEDGYMRAPAIGSNQSTTQTIMFITTSSNQVIHIRAKSSTSSYAKLYIGKVDNSQPTSSGNYERVISGTSQDTGDIALTIANAGQHFICICYTRGGNYGSDLYAKFIVGQRPIWRSDAKTYNSSGAIDTWTTPIKMSGNGSDEATQMRANLILQSSFLATRMDQWLTKNGVTTNGLDGRNGYKGNPDYALSYKELLAQNMYDTNGDQRLLANTWYTLSFWAKADPYIQIDKYETSTAYGFAKVKPIYFEAGVQNTIWVNGFVSSSALNENKSLRVFVYGDGENEGWGSTIASVKITATSSTTASATFTVPTTGWYNIMAYVYLEPSGGNSAVNGHTATVNWYRIDRGMRLMSYLYPTRGTQSTYTAIDTSAGRIKDGEFISNSSSPTDNNAEWLLSEVWTRHTLTFKTRSSIPSSIQQLIFRMHQASNGVYVCMPKLEQGTIATAFCTNDNDVADMAVDDTGFPNDRNIWVDEPDEPYLWNDERRDFVAYEISGEWKRYFVKSKGMVVPTGVPPTAGGNTFWSEGSRINTLLVNTIVGANASLTFAKTNRFLVTKADGTTVAAGLGGAEDGDYDYPLWIGATYNNRANAPFKVNLLGYMYSTRGYIGSWVIKEQSLYSQLGKINGKLSTDYENQSFVPNLTLNALSGELSAGDILKIDGDGMRMFNGNTTCLRMTSRRISSQIDTSPSTGSGTVSGSYSKSLFLPTATSGYTNSNTWIYKFDLGQMYTNSTIRVQNATIKCTFPTSVGNSRLSYLGGTVSVYLQAGGVKKFLLSSQNIAYGATSVDVTLPFDSNITIDGSTYPEQHYYISYEVEVRFSSSGGSSGSSENKSIIVSNSQYNYSRAIETLLLFGTNGIFNRQSIDTYMWNTEDGFLVRKGNYALRVTSNGVQKSTNGGSSWSNL